MRGALIQRICSMRNVTWQSAIKGNRAILLPSPASRQFPGVRLHHSSSNFLPILLHHVEIKGFLRYHHWRRPQWQNRHGGQLVFYFNLSVSIGRGNSQTGKLHGLAMWFGVRSFVLAGDHDITCLNIWECFNKSLLTVPNGKKCQAYTFMHQNILGWKFYDQA